MPFVPNSPQNVMVSIDEDNLFSVINWDQVTKDTSNSTTTILNYKIYKAIQSNLNDMILISTVTTTDINSKIDTIYIDINVDLTKNAYYQITATNSTGESAPSSIAFDLIKLTSQLTVTH